MTYYFGYPLTSPCENVMRPSMNDVTQFLLWSIKTGQNQNKSLRKDKALAETFIFGQNTLFWLNDCFGQLIYSLSINFYERAP